jgi:hypothetical protein
MKIKVTTTIDPYLKSAFEATNSLHNKSLAEVLEEGIEQTLEDISPLDAIKLEISKTEQKLSELRPKLAELEIMDQQNKASRKKEKEERVDEQLQDKRMQKFRQEIDSALVLLRKGYDLNWKKMAPKYQFYNMNEFKKCYFKTMNEEGIIM